MKKLLVMLLLVVNQVFAASDGLYLSLPSDTVINSGSYALYGTIHLPNAAHVVVQSDGRIFPQTMNSAANLVLYIDDEPVSNNAILDWRGAWFGLQHSYNIVGGKYLAAGTHRVILVADKLPGSDAYVLGADSNLSVIVNPAENVSYGKQATDSQTFNFTTVGDDCFTFTNEPHIPLVNVPFYNPRVQDLFVLASARAYKTVAPGDAMLGLYIDGRAYDNASVWPVEDLYEAAQLHAPMSSHGHFKNVAAGNRNVSLDATEFPWCGNPAENSAQYVVANGSTVVVMAGGMQVKGSAPQPWDNMCIAGTRAGCPAAGTVNTISQATIYIPPGHNGIVMFSAKMRVQPQANDNGSAFMWLDIDGKQVGSLAVGDIKAPAGVSQKTMYASYLATGANKLSPGYHTVKVYAKVDGVVEFVTTSHINHPLIWFD